MAEQVEVDFIDGSATVEEKRTPAEILDLATEGRRALACLSLNDILDLIQALGDRLLERSNPLHRCYPGTGLPYIASWCRRSNLKTVVDGSIQPKGALDGWKTDPVRADRELRAWPRGTVIHWMAGNVPTLGFLSLLMGLLTRNGNIVKVASKSDRLLADLLDQLGRITLDNGISGQTLARAVHVVRFERTRTELGSVFSQGADARIIWGGNESVLAIRRLPVKQDTVDIAFPNRTSFMILGGVALDDENLEGIARRVARDVSVFEQRACASPHTIFLQTGDKKRVKFFAEALARGLESTLGTIPKTAPTEKEVAAILNLRAQYDMLHDAWYSSGTQFTILTDDETSLGTPVGNRTVWLRRLTDPDTLVRNLPTNVQSVGLAVDDDQRLLLTDLLGAAGVFRFTQVGSMTNFELPWDGYLIPQALVRWTSRPRRGS